MKQKEKRKILELTIRELLGRRNLKKGDSSFYKKTAKIYYNKTGNFLNPVNYSNVLKKYIR